MLVWSFAGCDCACWVSNFALIVGADVVRDGWGDSGDGGGGRVEGLCGVACPGVVACWDRHGEIVEPWERRNVGGRRQGGAGMGTMPAPEGIPEAGGMAAGRQGIDRHVAWRCIHQFLAGTRGHSCLRIGIHSLKGVPIRRSSWAERKESCAAHEKEGEEGEALHLEVLGEVSNKRICIYKWSILLEEVTGVNERKKEDTKVLILIEEHSLGT